MKQYLLCLLGVIFFSVTSSFTPATGQSGVFSPTDPVVTYNPSAPPTKPANGQVGKWVRTPRVSFSTSSFKCYIYNNIPFRLKYPKNYDPSKSYPLMMFFHGIGEFGNGSIYDNEYQLYLGGQRHSGAVDNGSFNGFLLYPQSPLTNRFSDGDLVTLNNLIESIMVPQLNVDPFRVYINGLSAGGNSTWKFMLRFPKLAAAITPISQSQVDYANELQKFKHIPIYHFQGGLDTDPSPITSRKLGNLILNGGGNYKYREFAGQGHSCWNSSWADGDYFPFYNRAHKANPWPAFGKAEFCSGEAISTTIGVTAGFDAYEWRRNGVTIPGATTNEITVTDLGTYDCRILKGSRWSIWSPTPVVIKLKATVSQPNIRTIGIATRHLPAPDGSTSVAIDVNSGFETYNWQKEGDPTVLSTTRFLTPTQTGNYTVQVTDKFSCQKTTFKVDAEDYTTMVGVIQKVTSDIGGGLKVSTIDANDYMDYSVNIPASGMYTFTARIASRVAGAQFQVQDGSGGVYATVNVPNTGGEETWSEVNATISLNAGQQTLRLYSTAAPRWDINYFQLTGSNTGSFAKVFTIVDANGANPPPPVSNLVASATSKSSIQLTWNQVGTPAFNETGFEVYQSTSADGPYKLVAITAANATNAIISDLDPGTFYYYKVRAINNTAASQVSGVVSAATQLDTVVPAAPLNLRVGSVAKSSIRLYWNKATDDVGVVKYDVYINGRKSYATSGIDMYVYNLLPNTTYAFTVRARDLAGNTSAPSNEVTGKTSSGSITQDPTMTPVNAENYSVYLNFNLDDPAAAPWNNTNVLPSAGYITPNLKNFSGNYCGAKMTIVNNFSGYNPGGMITGNNSGVYDDNVLRSSYYNDQGNVAKLEVSGLSLRHKYSFVFLGSRNGGGDRTTVYTVNNQNVYLNASFNTSNTVQIDNITPDLNGNVTIEVSINPGADFAYMNSLVIKGYKTESSGQNEVPVSNAGVDKSVTLPVSTLSLEGSGTDVDGTIASYLWTRTSGPSSAVINQPSSATTSISNLVEGTYTFRLAVTDNAGATGFDDVEVVVLPAPPPAGTRFVKVNLFGGSNPYSNAEWNNWNVSSSLTSGTLAFSDNTSSGITASISKHTLSDNGASYGGTMAPPEVLRYTSYGTAARTLTLSGLSATKTYNLELYAARANTGHSTTFTVAGSAVTILTDNNKSNKALFTTLTADASGKLVVSIASVNTYNYLNGFILTENVPAPGAPTADAGPDQGVSLPGSTTTLSGAASDADGGTITGYSWAKLSGGAATLSDPTAASTSVSGLVEGVYTFRLTVTDNDGLTAFDDVQVVVAAAPPPAGTRLVKVNLFGGSNPYGSPEWNNWNVSSSLSSGGLKYSDAATSGISAALSRSSGINDNGAGYGSGMAPAEVLRHSSSSTSSRTLTISGLGADKTYALELYASRGNYSGNFTGFTVDGATQSISTFNNLEQRAEFTNLTASATGKITVSITNAQSYNYLNGFILTEVETGAANAAIVSGGAAEAAGTSAGMAVSSPLEPGAAKVLGASVHPNPAQNVFSLVISGGDASGFADLKVWDVSGRVVDQRRNLAVGSRVSMGSNWHTGLYYAELTQGTQTITLKLIKQK